MADFNLNMRQTASPKLMGRTVLLGRMKIAQALHMKEPEWAKLLSEVEHDPLVQELLNFASESSRAIRYKPFQPAQLSNNFYDAPENDVAGGAGEAPESLLNKRKELIPVIKKMGQAAFEANFLYRSEIESDEAIATKLSISVAEVKALHDFILEMSVHSEFFHPSALQSHNLIKPTLVGEIYQGPEGAYVISYYSPHLARGRYEINTPAVKRWQAERKLDRAQAAKLRKYIGLLELSNLKQGAFWKVVEYLLRIQKDYLSSNDIGQMAPVSLRDIAKALNFAPSTISRVMANKSVLLPWKEEVLLTALMPGQRRVVLSILKKIMTTDDKTDLSLAKQIQDQFGIIVSRRTITTCRHVLTKGDNNPSIEKA